MPINSDQVFKNPLLVGMIIVTQAVSILKSIGKLDMMTNACWKLILVEAIYVRFLQHNLHIDYDRSYIIIQV